MPTGFLLKTTEDIKFLTIPSFEATGLVTHCFTTRQGGVSESPFASLNLATHVQDDLDKVLSNRELICNALGVQLKQVVAGNQVHGNRVFVVTNKDIGLGAYSKDDAIPETDALITNEPGVVLTSYYADCVPLFILDPIKKIIGLAHAGWKGTALKIGAVTIAKMVEQFGSCPENLLVAIGPSVGPCCYEVDERVLAEFRQGFTGYKGLITNETGGKANLNLWEANKQVFLEAGVVPENITSAEICTSCHTDLFFSYRKENGQTGRMSSILMLIN